MPTKIRSDGVQQQLQHQQQQQRYMLFGAAALLRLVLFIGFPVLADLLTARVEVSTPVTSYKRLQEGLFLYTHSLSPYDGGVYHQAPLLLSLFSLLPATGALAGSLVTCLLYIIVDLVSASALMTIAESGEAGSSRLYTSPRRDKKWSSLYIAAFFLFNPFTIATCLGRPTSVFTTAAILHAIAAACHGRAFHAMTALAMAAYLSMYPVLLLPPLLLLTYDRRPISKAKASLITYTAQSIPVFLTAVTTLLYTSSHLLKSWSFVPSTYGVQLLMPDLTPNTGLWWYFFIEMFDSFRHFFLAVFWLHLASYTPGLTIRLRSQPLFVLTTLLGLYAIFKPYPSISDTSLYLALLPLYRHVFPLMRYGFLASSVVLYACLLGPAFYYLWIYAGSGNANFFYAITLVWSLGLGLLGVADAVYAVLRDEWEAERPEMRGREAKQI